MKSLDRELKGLRYQQQFLAILIFSLVTVVIWVIVGLTTSQTTVRIPPELQALAKPLNPNINEAILTEIEQKRRFSPEELSAFPIYRLFTETDLREQAQAAAESRRAASTEATPSALASPATASATPATTSAAQQLEAL